MPESSPISKALVAFGVTIFADLIREPVTVLLLLGYIIFLDWKLTFLLLLVCPPIIFIISSLSRGVRKYSHQQQETMEDFTSTLKETVDGVRIIQSAVENDVNGRVNLAFQGKSNGIFTLPTAVA